MTKVLINEGVNIMKVLVCAHKAFVNFAVTLNSYLIATWRGNHKLQFL